MAGRQSPNLHPIKFTRSPDLTNGHDDISQLFQNAEDEGSGGRNKPSLKCSSWFGEPELIVYKLFYLFFYAATALFAYLPLYYKNSLLLDHRRVGILMGIRPFCAFLGAPVLGSFADKFNKYKCTLYTGLLTYIIVYLSITFVNGVPKDCDVQTRINYTNTTHKAPGTNTFLNAIKQEQALEIHNTEKFSQHLANIIAKRNDIRLRREQSQKSSELSDDGKIKFVDKPVYFSEDAKELPREKVVFKEKFDHVDAMNGRSDVAFQINTADSLVDNITRVCVVIDYIIQITTNIQLTLDCINDLSFLFSKIMSNIFFLLTPTCN